MQTETFSSVYIWAQVHNYTGEMQEFPKPSGFQTAKNIQTAELQKGIEGKSSWWPGLWRYSYCLGWSSVLPLSFQAAYWDTDLPGSLAASVPCPSHAAGSPSLEASLQYFLNFLQLKRSTYEWSTKYRLPKAQISVWTKVSMAYSV